MVTERNTARIVGVLILIAYVVIGSLMFESVTISMLLELITGAAVIGMAILMFPILKPVNKNLSLGYSTIKAIDGLLIIIGQQSPATGLLRVAGFKNAQHDFIDPHFRRTQTCPGFGQQRDTTVSG